MHTKNEVVIANRGLHSNKCKKKWQQLRSPAYFEYRQKWHEYPEKQYLSPFPLHLDLDITNACNLRCKMCARTIMIEKGNTPDIGFMDFDFVKHLIDEGASQGLASIKFSFQGEPLLHPKIVEIVTYAKKAGIIDTMFNTNGMLLTTEMSEALLDAGLDNIFFSIDSAYKENYEAIRVGANYDKVIENILNFIRLRKVKEKHAVQIGVNMVVMEENKDEVDDFIKQWSNIVDTVNWGLDHHFVLKEKPEIINDIKTEPDNFCCSQLWQRLIVNWDGECLPCCLDVERDLLVGNTHNNSLQQIWLHSKLYKLLREKHKSGNYQDIKRCKHCAFALLKHT
jgi:radical SAM protein with 4Fe4S-binding SPASM domain